MEGIMKKSRENARPDPGKKEHTALYQMKKHWQLYLVILLPVVYVVIFSYIPMYGVQIAFKDFIASKGITGSPWAGLKYFERFIGSYNFWLIIYNTISISFYSLIVGFPFPIILALALNEAFNQRFKKTVQMVTYAPYFISTIVMVSMLLQLLSLRLGIVNHLLAALGFERINFMAVPGYFKSIYVFSGVWQYAGYNSIIYLAALSSIDPVLYEAAIVDGASKLQKIIHIDLPGILPTAVIILILDMGRIMNVGFEKTFAMQNPLNYSVSEVISTYVYKLGIERADFSFASAIGLFNSVVNLILLVCVNAIARKFSETSLW